MTQPDPAPEAAPDTDDEDARFEALLEYLKSARGLDFTGYKRSSLRRRVAKRMHELGIDDVAALQDHLQVHPEEFTRLFDAILINVTSFFRDAEAWAHLAEEIIPRIVEGAGDGPIRLWSAGCASGEEAYTLAMLMADAIGDDAARRRVKIYATDIDEDALVTARAAVFDDAAVATVPEDLRTRYFEELSDGRHRIRSDLRRMVIFGRHDLVHDAPISRLDLVVCRNVLMYFNRETQAGVLQRLRFATRSRGYLFLGRAEMLLTRSSLFEPVDLRHRVFRPTDAALDLAPRPRPDGDTAPTEDAAALTRLRDEAFDAGPTAQLVLDADSIVTLVNERCRTMFGLQEHDVGRPLRDLEVSYRPVELRSHVDQVLEERRPIQLRAVERTGPEHAPQYLDILLAPLVDNGRLVGISVAFTDVTPSEVLRGRLHQANKDLETSYEELQSTNEELETTNEELQSSNEELETTNEELQSSNEELETMNEELQSANAQQAEVAAELARHTDELDEINTFLQGILASLRSAVIVLDADLTVRVWSAQAFEDWGLRSDEAEGRSLLSLDIGLPVADLANAARAALDGVSDTIELDAVTRRGRPVQCNVTVTPLQRDGTDGARGAVLLTEVADAASAPEEGPDG